ncbi:MAG: creatininase family protein [Planctomycetota bacterium]
MTELAKRTWPEARELFASDPIALVPIATTEPHGPHLPLDTDITIAEAQARRAEELLAEAGVPSVRLACVPFGLTRFAEGFEGRICLRPGTLWALVEDLIESLAEQGIRRIVILNGHLEQEHVQVLRGVVSDFAEAPDKGRPQVVLADVTRRRFAERLGDEFLSGECHAGRYEASIVMAADPDGVREAERVALPPLTIGLIEKMRAGVTSFRDAGADAAYCGDPAAASAAEGRALIDSLASIVVDLARETWPERFPERANER